MGQYILKRILISIIVVFLVTVFVFALIHMLPGDPARLYLGFEASEADVQEMRVKMNLDKPWHVQYYLWMNDVFHGDLGDSLLYRRPNLDIFKERIPRTVSIGIPALLISVPIALIFGIICAIKRGKWIDNLLTFFITLGMGTPVFWVSILAIYIFAMWLKLLPIQGYVSPADNFNQYLYKATLPVLCMATHMIAGVARNTRTYMLETLNQDYIRTHRAFGISERKITAKYALKNALIPVVTVLGFQVRVIIGGSLLIEQVFNIPGLGTLLVLAVNNRDYILIQNCVLMIASFTVLVSLIVDILYGYIDPRIRLSRR
ncbi:MAG: ABC transporter permease [Clostridiaceae bacterium]|jgi:peptide/nickel transport system permease protein|nr:ABC transporter permease [Clostridiaceae bacterium]